MPRVRQLPRPRTRVRFASLALALALLVGWAAPATAQLRIQATAEDPSHPSLIVAPTDVVLDVDESVVEYRFEAKLESPGDAPTNPGTLTLWLGDEPLQQLPGPAELTPGVVPDNASVILEREIEVIEAGELIEMTLTAPRAVFGEPRENGVYLVRAEYVSDDATQFSVAEVPVIWGDIAAAPEGEPEGDGEITPALAPVQLGLIVPLVLPSGGRTVPDGVEIAEVAPGLLTMLTAAETHRATLAVDPRIIVGIRALGTAAPEPGVELLERLESTTSPVFLLQFADADPAAQAALDFTELLSPLGFGYVLRDGTFEPADGTDADGTDLEEQTDSEEESEPTEPSDPAEEDSDTDGDGDTDPVEPSDDAPTTAELLTLENAHLAAWPAEGQADFRTLTLLRTSGMESVVLSSQNVTNATAPRAQIAGLGALITDFDLQESATLAMTGSIAESLKGEAELLAKLALAAKQGSTGMILALDRGALTEGADPQDLLTRLDALSWVDFTPTDLLTEGAGALQAGATADDRREQLQELIEHSAQVDELAPLLVNPEYLIEYQRARLLEAFATKYAAPSVDFADVAERNITRDNELLQGVHPVPAESTQLVGASSRVPVTLRNALPFDTAVQVRVMPQSAAVTLPEHTFDAVVAASGRETVLVPVQSRVASGDSALLVSLFDQDGQQKFAEATLPITLRTMVETTLLIGLGTATALLFGFGIWRSVRRRRASGITEA